MEPKFASLRELAELSRQQRDLTDEVRQLKLGLEKFAAQQSSYAEEQRVVLECLVQDFGFNVESFYARLHRRRFEDVLSRHPLEGALSCAATGRVERASVETVLRSTELLLAAASYSGQGGLVALANASRILRQHVSSNWRDLQMLFPPDVLVVGGFGMFGTVLSTAERFSVSAGRWTGVASMMLARCACSAAALCGRVYVVGGRDVQGNLLSSVECYDPSHDRWTLVPPLPEARADAAVTATTSSSPCGAMLVAVGGCSSDAAACSEAYLLTAPDTVLTGPHDNDDGRVEAVHSAWEVCPSTRQPRKEGAAAAIGSNVYFVGGTDLRGEQVGTMERFDLQLNRSWASAPPLRRPRASLAFAAVKGQLYAVGGVGPDLGAILPMEKFDPVTGEWHLLESPNLFLSGPCACNCAGTLLVLGGSSSTQTAGGSGNGSVVRYDPRHEAWAVVPIHNVVRHQRDDFAVALCTLCDEDGPGIPISEDVLGNIQSVEGIGHRLRGRGRGRSYDLCSIS